MTISDKQLADLQKILRRDPRGDFEIRRDILLAIVEELQDRRGRPLSPGRKPAPRDKPPLDAVGVDLSRERRGKLTIANRSTLVRRRV